MKLTKAQQSALDWLTVRGGDGAFIKGGVTIIAQGEIAPCTRGTWNALRDAGHVMFYNPDGRGYGRAKVVKR